MIARIAVLARQLASSGAGTFEATVTVARRPDPHPGRVIGKARLARPRDRLRRNPTPATSVAHGSELQLRVLYVK